MLKQALDETSRPASGREALFIVVNTFGAPLCCSNARAASTADAEGVSCAVCSPLDCFCVANKAKI